MSDRLYLPLFVRLANIEPGTAQRMGEECESFLRSKGYRDISVEYSDNPSLEAIETEIFTPVDLVAMGIRSKYTFHDLHVGVLAKHFQRIRGRPRRCFASRFPERIRWVLIPAAPL